MKIQKNSKVVFIGDSITDMGRSPGVAEGLFDPLGKCYVTLTEALLTATYPQLGIRVVNVGCSGNTVRDLKTRWQRDVTDLKADWLSVSIGINDVWRQFDCPKQKEWHVLPDEYERTYSELLEKTRPSLKGLILIAPHFIEPNRKDAMRARMDEYGAIVKKLAKKYDALFVDPQAGFDRLLKFMHAEAIAWDRVHPNQAGHMVITRALLDAVEFEW